MPDEFGGFSGGGAPHPHAQVYQPGGSPYAIAPREGRLVISQGADAGKWFDVSRAKRWACVTETSPYFGTALYRTALGAYVHYSPGGDILPTAVVPVTNEEAVAFLKREGFDIPPDLKPTEAAQEV